MPEGPIEPKRQATVNQPAEPRGSVPYAELHTKTNFSFLEGASHPDELVERAALLGYQALAITDRNSLAGVVRAHAAAKEAKLRLLIGAEVTPSDGPTTILLATDRCGYANLAKLLTRGRRRAKKGSCILHWADLVDHAVGLLALVPVADWARHPEIASWLGRLRETFADRAYGLVECHLGPDDAHRLARTQELARRAGIPLAAANDVHYHDRCRQRLHDILTAIRHRTTLAGAVPHLFPNAERELLPFPLLQQRLAQVPGALERTLEIADRARFSLDELRHDYPQEPCPAGENPTTFLTRLTWEGANQRYPDGVPEKVRSLIEHELRLIQELGYERYFLTVWDLVRFARSKGILCQGRGSAANSAVCYALGVTAVDPDRIDVLFERFVSKERQEAPDIDIDFEHERREEVLQYLYGKYGRERAGLTAVVITYRTRSAAREVAKALGFSSARVDALARSLASRSTEGTLSQVAREAGLAPETPRVQQWRALVEELVGFPRHLSQHPGGMVLTQSPLSEIVPIENAAMVDRTVIEWDKDDLDTIGLLKVDCLGLGMLTAIRKSLALVGEQTGRPLALADVPPEDPAVYSMIQQADTIGVFQIESRAQMSMLPRLKPACFYDLVIEVAIVRPGPIQGKMVHPYLRRRNGEEPIEYPSEAIRSVLEKTLGVPLFQEQVMQLAVVAAGFTPGEADQLRRAMAAWRRTGVIERFGQKLIDGMTARGLAAEFAERVFAQIRGFGEYGFPESHAASFALLVYVSAWLKRHYPAAFTAGLLNSQPMGFYAPAQIIRDAKEHGVEVRPIDINTSRWDVTLERTERPDHPALRLGFRLAAGLVESDIGRLLAERDAHGPFRSVEDLSHRCGTRKNLWLRLSQADALRSLVGHRRRALWEALPRRYEVDLPLFADLDRAGTDEPIPPLQPLEECEEVLVDYRTVGLSLRNHPIAFLREPWNRARVVPAARLADLPHGKWVRVGGLAILRQRPSTAKGITFMTLEDETGVINLVVRPEIWEKYRKIARLAVILLASGRLEKQGSILHLLVRQFENASAALAPLPPSSPDFH